MGATRRPPRWCCAAARRCGCKCGFLANRPDQRADQLRNPRARPRNVLRHEGGTHRTIAMTPAPGGSSLAETDSFAAVAEAGAASGPLKRRAIVALHLAFLLSGFPALI